MTEPLLSPRPTDHAQQKPDEAKHLVEENRTDSSSSNEEEAELQAGVPSLARIALSE